MKLSKNLVFVVKAVLDEVIFKWKKKAGGISSISAPSSITSYTALAFNKQSNVPISTFRSFKFTSSSSISRLSTVSTTSRSEDRTRSSAGELQALEVFQ